MNEDRITYFAETDARGKRVKFGIKAKDRTRHVYVIGKTGMGKSTLLENMAVQDIQNGEGMAFIDPHGKTADLLLEYIPEHRVKDVVYFAPFDMEHPISFNVLENVDPDKRHLVVSGLMSTFKKIWQDAWSARMEYILTNTLLALLEYPDATLLGVNRMLSDKPFRNKVVSCITDPSVRSFWVDEFANYTERMAAEAVPAIQNKIGQFTANPLIRNMIGQPRSSFNIREIMDSKKIIIINLSKGRIGESNANLLGGMLITKIYLAAMSRADVPDRVLKVLPNFYLFVDEFQNFANESFADILSEARKYKLNLTIAHQYIEQMEEEVRAAVFGNVGTMIVFRVGAYDAEVLEKEFAPQFTMEDIVNLGFAQIYLKLMIDGISSSPFSATTLGPIPHPARSFVNEVIAASREQFADSRIQVEQDVVDWMQPIKPSAKGGGNSGGNGGAVSGGNVASKPPMQPSREQVPRVQQVPVQPPTPPQQPPRPVQPVQTPPPAKIRIPDEVVAQIQQSVQKPIQAPPQESRPPRPKPATPGLADLLKQVSVERNTPKPKAPKQEESKIEGKKGEPEAVKPVSLDTLKKDAGGAHVGVPQQRKDAKTQTPQNVQSLKDALAKAGAGKKVETKESVQEVPQDVLEKVLKVE